MTSEEYIALLFAVGVGMGIVARWIIEAYTAVFWLFWDIVQAVVD